MPVAMTQNGQKYYLHYDQVGSLRAVSDSSHTIVKEIVYDTYGTILTDSNPSFTVPFGFAGGLYDTDTKLTRFGYRDYDAYTGKWTAKDPIGFSGGDSNLYGYVLGGPVGFFDPSGLSYLDIDIRNDPRKPRDPIRDLPNKPIPTKPSHECCDWFPKTKGDESYKKIRDWEKKWTKCCENTDVLPVCPQ